MAKIKGTFSRGWWNCFYSFADELLSENRNAAAICTRILEGAGITKKEAEWQLEHSSGTLRAVDEIIRDYWLNLR